MKEESLLRKGYRKVAENEYIKYNKETKLNVRLKFNPNGSAEENRKINQNIINILTRQDI